MSIIVFAAVSSLFAAGVSALLIPLRPAKFRLPFIFRAADSEGRKRRSRTAGLLLLLLRLKKTKRGEVVQKELYSALSVLRNYASAEGGTVTTDFILEQFTLQDGVLKGAFSGALRLLRTGRRGDAADYFAAAAGVPLARDFILLVLDWDAVPPQKLRQAVISFQNAIKETRTTELIRKTETMSDLVYLPVVAGVLVVFVNFIYVVYFAEQRELLAELFF